RISPSPRWRGAGGEGVRKEIGGDNLLQPSKTPHPPTPLPPGGGGGALTINPFSKFRGFDMNDRFPPHGGLPLGFRRTLAALLALTVTGLAGPARAQEASEAPKKVVAIEGITEYKLPNGLRVLLFPDPSSSKVTVNLTMLVGSRHEGYGET